MRHPNTCTHCLPAALLLVLLASNGLGIPAAAGAAPAGDSGALWHENTELRAMRCLPEAKGSVSPDDEAPYAEVFDSADFQTMLVLQKDWPVAFTLDLATGEVARHLSSEVLGANGRLLRPDDGEVITTFASTTEGRIEFGSLEYDYVIEPLPPLVGELSRAELERRQPAYLRRALDYRPDPEKIAVLGALEDEFEIVAFFGTWCQICKHTLPALLATLDAADSATFHLTLIGTDEDMSVPEEWIVEYDLEFTPTIVVLRQGIELGRIQEEALVSVEADLVEIISAAARQ